jgi:hypothetical protein
MHRYMYEIQTSTTFSTNSIKKQNWKCYKAATFLVNDHDANSSSTTIRIWSTHVENILYVEAALSR